MRVTADGKRRQPIPADMRYLDSESRLECRISECRISIPSTSVPLGFDRGTEVDHPIGLVVGSCTSHPGSGAHGALKHVLVACRSLVSRNQKLETRSVFPKKNIRPPLISKILSALCSSDYSSSNALKILLITSQSGPPGKQRKIIQKLAQGPDQ